MTDDPAHLELARELAEADLFGLDATVAGGHLTVGDGTDAVTVPLVRRAVVTPEFVATVLAEHPSGVLVVGDLVHADAKAALAESGSSYWDRRGELGLVIPELRLRLRDATRSYVGPDVPDPFRPVAGTGALSVAVAALLRPDRPMGVRAVARAAGMAPSTISRARRLLTEANLLHPDGRPLLPELFWATSDAWLVEWTPVAEEPSGPDWYLAADAAAAGWGAATLATDRRLYGADPEAVARLRIGEAVEPGSAACLVAVPPTPVALDDAVDGIVAPVVAALDLSRDARGREILSEWAEIRGDPEAPTPWR